MWLCFHVFYGFGEDAEIMNAQKKVKCSGVYF